MVNISANNLAAELTKAVQEYTDDVSDAITVEVDETAEKVLTEARARARKCTGKYAKNLKKTKEDEHGKTRRIIWNKKYFWLVHLLEFGHAKRGGGRVLAYPHMEPAYEQYGATLTERIKRIIEKGGGK